MFAFSYRNFVARRLPITKSMLSNLFFVFQSRLSCWLSSDRNIMPNLSLSVCRFQFTFAEMPSNFRIRISFGFSKHDKIFRIHFLVLVDKAFDWFWTTVFHYCETGFCCSFGVFEDELSSAKKGCQISAHFMKVQKDYLWHYYWFLTVSKICKKYFKRL